jgi:hypothetical protein
MAFSYLVRKGFLYSKLGKYATLFDKTSVEGHKIQEFMI